MKISIVTLLLFLQTALAQNGISIAEPVLGKIYDAPTQSLRSVLGVPGAAWLGPPQSVSAEAGALSPNGKFLVLVAEGRCQLRSVDLELLLNFGECDKRFELFFGAGGDRLVLASHAARRVWTAAWEGSSWRVVSEVAWPEEAEDCLAVALGSSVWFASRTVRPDNAGGLYRLSPFATWERLNGANGLDGLALRDGRLVFSAGRQLISASETQPEALRLEWTSPSGTLRLVAAISSTSFLLERNDGDSHWLLLEGGSEKDLGLAEFPGLRGQALAQADPSLQLLNRRLHKEEPVLVLGGGAEPRVYFVPEREQ